MYRDEEQKNQLLLGYEIHQTIMLLTPDCSYTHERSGTCCNGGTILGPGEGDSQRWRIASSSNRQWIDHLWLWAVSLQLHVDGRSAPDEERRGAEATGSSFLLQPRMSSHGAVQAPRISGVIQYRSGFFIQNT